jgi:hypothetical protein
MPTEEEYVERITRLRRSDLLKLWEAIEAGDTPGWEPGKAFEYLLLRAFQLEKAEVRWPYTVKLARLGGDTVEQIDGVVYATGLACVAEMKDEKVPLDIGAVAKLRLQLARRPAASVGLLFSRSGFTEPARILTYFVSPQTILLWDGGEIRYALARRKLVEGVRRKYEVAVEQGVPDYNLLDEQES